MKKIIGIASITLAFVVGCSVKSQADSDKASQIESVDEYNTFTLIKIVDKETGCKYLITNKHKNAGSTEPSAPVQMLDKDGLPLCNRN